MPPTFSALDWSRRCCKLASLWIGRLDVDNFHRSGLAGSMSPILAAALKFGFVDERNDKETRQNKSTKNGLRLGET